MQPVNLLAVSAMNPAQLAALVLHNRLLLTCSTWERQRQSVSRAAEGIVLAMTSSDCYLSTSELGLCEMLAANWIRRRMIAGCNPISLVNANRLNHEQLPAARMLCANPIACLYGLPGTGKTFVLKSVFDSFIAARMEVAIISFTGAAASRLGEVLESEGMTIHRFLRYNGNHFEYNANNLHSADVVIIDEAGQLGAVLHWNVLSALRDDCIVIYTGDPNQLPSIEPGNTLADLIQCVPSAQLKLVMRTNPGGPIGLAARAMLAGEVPQNAEDSGDGFYTHPCSDEGLNRVGHIAQSKMADIHKIPFESIRTLCPTNKLVRAYNKYCLDKLDIGQRVPIIARRNNYDYNYFNGDTGYLECNTVYINDSRVPYINNEAVHAYGWASTTYVAQGKEFDAAQFLIPRLGGGKPCFAEVYTAVTRAKKRFIVLGCMAAFAAAIKSGSKNKRVSLLPLFVSGGATIQSRGN